MKLEILLFSFTIFLLSCIEDDPFISENDLIKLPSVESFIAEGYKTYSKAVFINPDLDTIELGISYDKRKANHELPNNESVDMEFFEIQLFHSSDTNPISINLQGSAFLSTDKRVKPFINIDYMLFYVQDFTWMTITIEDMVVSSTFENNFYSSLQINSEMFEQVFRVENKESDIYSTIFFNQKHGIIGFIDGHGILWNFKNFKI